MKRCRKCNEVKDVSSFYQSKGHPASYCKECTKRDVAEWVRKNPERFRRTQRRSVLKRQYGLTEEQYDLLLATRNGTCWICGAEPHPVQGLHVDHCHTTGRVRGLLCSKCNQGIGYMRDNPDHLRNAAAYLRKHQYEA